MKVLNQTNIVAAERIIRVLASGVDTRGLVVRVKRPETKEEKNCYGMFYLAPPTIKVLAHTNWREMLRDDPIFEKVSNLHQYVAAIFLHELYHYRARQKNMKYRRIREEHRADFYAAKTLELIGLNKMKGEKS